MSLRKLLNNATVKSFNINKPSKGALYAFTYDVTAKNMQHCKGILLSLDGYMLNNNLPFDGLPDPIIIHGYMVIDMSDIKDIKLNDNINEYNPVKINLINFCRYNGISFDFEKNTLHYRYKCANGKLTLLSNN